MSVPHGGEEREVVHRPEREGHERGEEKRRGGERRVNDLLLGDQVHEVTRHEEGLHAGNEESDGDASRRMGLVEFQRGGPHCQHGT